MSPGAALHAGDLLKQGFTVGQVVHDYGDVCQSVTELAEELGVEIATSEFHTLNRCLDNVTADAVTEYDPGFRFRTRYSPASFACVSRVVLSFRFVT